MTNVTVIGLGPMGHALADLLLKAGQTVTVWNRSADKASALVERGATMASSPAAAIAASPITIVCVLDYAGAEAILASEGASSAMKDRLIVNLGTGSPSDARHLESLVHQHGGRYLDGAIQAAPSQMGQDDTPLFVSGRRPHFDEAQSVLRVFAGNVEFLGEEIDAAAYMDLATLSYVYGAYAGFIHGANIAGATGIDVATYGRLVNSISPSFGAFFQHEGNVIASGDFRVTESPLRISIPAVRRILQASQQLGIDTQVPALVDGWLQRADDAGLANEELAALIKVVRQRQSISAAA
ncbi:NAD(P)-dependent oxidoreductase [Montanilutibacter psychrotolerans]|uniref:NAD(P)-dependent oxidoreductase n=1 Tax=Montanilutibacter psychrotolerans TaxID=1327343 RepID=A0A3M8T5L5_9GAMM|nr:NAD(P)-binding domain-containing protein [Lysobacter psychrotolerans]RNF86490.1 NAD(P)-dependent oxidoreductase [Lysobacter psychrotolerans]